MSELKRIYNDPKLSHTKKLALTITERNKQLKACKRKITTLEKEIAFLKGNIWDNFGF